MNRSFVPLDRAFYERDAHDVARDLLGHVVARHDGDGICAGRIVEVEVYGGADDPACHADRGMTARTRSMYGDPGHAYVYRIYGMYDCLNVVCPRGDTGKASAILIRALEPLMGTTRMVRRRGLSGPLDSNKTRRALLSGPGKLCQALAIDRGLDGHPLHEHPLFIAAGEDVPSARIRTSPRIGLNPRTCGEATDFEWRYVVEDSQYLSR